MNTVHGRTVFMLPQSAQRPQRFSVKDCVLNLTSILSASFAPFAVLFLLNRRGRRDRKGFRNGFHIKSYSHHSPRPLRPSRFYF